MRWSGGRVGLRRRIKAPFSQGARVQIPSGLFWRTSKAVDGGEKRVDDPEQRIGRAQKVGSFTRRELLEALCGKKQRRIALRLDRREARHKVGVGGGGP